MTIAACYPCLEGVVFGADSTTTIFVPGPTPHSGQQHHYTFCQKVFEFGERGSSAGIVTWGLGALPHVSYRTIIAEAADAAIVSNVGTLEGVVNVFVELFWVEYSTALQQVIQRAQALEVKGNRTDQEQSELEYWKQTQSVGFCVGGRWGQSRRPEAYEIVFTPLLNSKPAPKRLVSGAPMYWGCPTLIERVIFGIDGTLFQGILGSGKWGGTPEELFDLVRGGQLTPPSELPIREAVDLVYAEIYTTIKAMKFSHLAPICGGPIETAVVTTDRPFRWVSHKRLSRAITEGYSERAEHDERQ
jgi:hypothetical protein